MTQTIAPAAPGTTRAIRPDIRDATLDGYMAEHAAAHDGEPWVRVPCSAPDRHPVMVEGMRIYLARLDAGISRAQLEDRLLDEGCDVTVERIAKWEEGEDVEDLPAQVLLALPRILGVGRADLVWCAECIRAARPALFAASLPTAGAIHEHLDGAKIAARRREFGLDREAIAVLAGVDVRTVELAERGKGRCVGVNDLFRIFEALDLEFVNLGEFMVEEPVGADAAVAS